MNIKEERVWNKRMEFSYLGDLCDTRYNEGVGKDGCQNYLGLNIKEEEIENMEVHKMTIMAPEIAIGMDDVTMEIWRMVRVAGPRKAGVNVVSHTVRGCGNREYTVLW